MIQPAVHRELLLPDPIPRPTTHTETPSPRPAIEIASGHISWLELHRKRSGSIRFHLGAKTEWEIDLTFASLLDAFPGAQLGERTPCPLGPFYLTPGQFLRTVPALKTHYWPMQRSAVTVDRAGFLLRALASRELEGHDVVAQLLFRKVVYWERGFFQRTTPIPTPKDTDPELLRAFQARMAGPAYHVELRARVIGDQPDRVSGALWAWLRTYSTLDGGPWWSFETVQKDRDRSKFFEGLRAHDIDRFCSKKVRRDLSGNELARLLPIPIYEHHPQLSYAGAPRTEAPRSLVPSSEDSGALIVGHTNGERVGLPPNWNHFVVLGKTRSGKSTLAQSVALQILARRPDATVVVLEPTGEMIRGITDRLTPLVAPDTVEMVPSHPTFEQDGKELATLPMNLLQLPNRRGMTTSEFERRAEKLSGDILQSIKNAWGEDSVGGRADFILRTLFQGLLAVEGTNLVDAYTVLSDKSALQNLELLSTGGLLKKALRIHLPKLDYQFTISSLDKVGKIATNPVLRKALCQRYHPVQFEQLLDRQLLLLNLAKGALGTEAARFLGAIFLTQLWSALQERPQKERPVYLIVDEFHNFAIPAFADMLSEGARLGLHVVAITQYLNRIPEKVRSALIGNVDAWMLFPLGAEDVELAHAAVDGDRFGWTPEHFLGGLGPRQAALATPGSLVKLDTFASPEPVRDKDAIRQAVLESSHRYSANEDSEGSPLGVTPLRLSSLLQLLPNGTSRSVPELAGALVWSETEVLAAVSLAKATGDVIQDENGRVSLEPRGVYHRDAIDTARNEGPEHSGLLADVSALVYDLGIAVRVMEQGGGFLRSDAEFEWGGRGYNIEVECSTLTKHPEQVVRNVRKALGSGRRCLVAVPDESMAERFVELLKDSFPEVKIWGDVGLMWRKAPGKLVPYVVGNGRAWGFLIGEGDEEEWGEARPSPESAERERSSPGTYDSDLARVIRRTNELLEAGRWEVTAKDFNDFLGLDAEGLPARVRLGMALESLGIKGYRKRVGGGEKVMHYDLRPLSSTVGSPAHNPSNTTVSDSAVERREGDYNQHSRTEPAGPDEDAG